MKSCIFALVMLIAINSVHADTKVLKSIISPNGKYTASIVLDETRHLQIKNIKDNKIIADIDDISVPCSLEWGNASDSIYIIDRLSHASILEIVSLRDGKWIITNYEGVSHITHADLENGDDSWSYLYKYKIIKNKIIAYFSYAVFKKNEDYASYSGIDIQTINLSTGKIEKTEHKKISYSKFENIRCSVPDSL